MVWKEVIKAKFGETNRWCTKTITDSYGVGVWRAIMVLWPLMEGNLKLKVGDGNKIQSWKEAWIDQLSWTISQICSLFATILKQK